MLSQKIRRDRQRKNFLKQGVQNMFSSAISGGTFLRHLAGSNSLYSNRTERSDAYTSIDSFIAGFELAWKLSIELNHYKNERSVSCRTAMGLGARFASAKEEEE